METITRRSLVTAAAGAFAVTALSACSSGGGSSASSGSTSASASTASASSVSAQEQGSLHVFIQHEQETPEWIAALPAAKDEKTTQLFVVAGLGMGKTTASISMHERGADGKWKIVDGK